MTSHGAELGVALVGCGDIGALRARAVRRAPGFRLRVACDHDAGRARAVSGGGAVEHERGAAVAVSHPDVDLVIVSTPPSSHAELAAAAFAAGKHVLVEKPLARTSAECRTMCEAAAAAGRLLATGFNYRFYPSVTKASELLAEGRIGALDHIRAYAGYPAAKHPHDWMRDPDVVGGGVLRDNGIHLIDLTCFFLGDVAEVRGEVTGRLLGRDGYEDNGFALLRGTSGAVATLHASWTEWRGYRFVLDLCGSRGTIRVSCFPMITDVVWAERIGGPSRRKRWLFPRTHLMEKLRSYRWVVEASFVAELAALRRALAGQSTPLASGRAGLVSVEVAEHASAGIDSPGVG